MSARPDCKTVVDVRDLPPRQRDPVVFSAFDALDPGEALLLVIDHQPRQIFSQFQAESRGLFSWDYLEQGPEIWRIRIGKAGENETLAVAHCCSH